MSYTLADLLAELDIEVIEEHEDHPALEMDLEIHTQQNYPLKGSLRAVTIKGDKLRLATGSTSEYGDKDAWEEY